MQNPMHLPPSAETIKEALLGALEEIDPMYQLLSTMEAVFKLIRHSEINPELKEAFETMYEQYSFYSNLVILERESGHELHR